MEYDHRRVNAAVKIKISLQRRDSRSEKAISLTKDLMRLRDSMSHEEYNEYLRRIA